jgi:hypothetical protein
LRSLRWMPKCLGMVLSFGPHNVNELLAVPDQRPQSSSASRPTAGASGFLNFNQSRVLPLRYYEPRRLDTMPSRPILHACRKTMPG